MNGAIVALGIFVLLGGIVLFAYPVTNSYSVLGQQLYSFTTYPYQTYGVIASIVGIIALIVGLALPNRSGVPAPPTTPQIQTQIPTYPCPTCGRPLRWIQEYQRWYCDAESKYA
jgi:hypothetical protein